MSSANGDDARDSAERIRMLLARHPDALVAALDDEGLLVQVPDGIAVGDRHRTSTRRSVLDEVIPADRVVVIAAWERAQQAGAAMAVVHLASEPDEAVSLHLVDARDTHGVSLAVFASDGEDRVHPAPSRADGRMAPRLAFTWEDEEGVIRNVDAATTRLLGWEPDDLIGGRWLDLIHPDDRQRATEHWDAVVSGVGHGHRARLRHRTADGSWVWVEVTRQRQAANGLAPGTISSELLDISEEMAVHESLRAREQLLYRMAESVPVGLLQISTEQRVVYTNERLHQITGTRAGSVIEEVLTSVVDDDRGTLDAVIGRVLERGEDDEVEARLRVGRHGELRLCTFALRALTDDDGAVSGALVCITDVTDRARMEAELQERATFDALTGTHNRASVMVSLEGVLEDPGEGVGILFVDIDRFKWINDVLGHAAGDEMLARVAERLREVLRGEDFIGRIGGDEFLVVCPDLATSEDAVAVAERIAAAGDGGMTISGRSLDGRVSIGVTHSAGRVVSADTLVAEADAAMYESKRRGEGQPVLYSVRVAHHSVLDQSEALDEDAMALRQAFLGGDLRMHLQPVVELGGGGTVGYEALVRWQDGAELRPARNFLETAESSGLIHEIDAWMFEELCQRAARAQRGDLRWFVNLSASELDLPQTSVDMIETVRRHDLSPSLLVVEVAGHVGPEQGSRAQATLQELAGLGCGVAIDDYGREGSSLALLGSIGIGWLKIDRDLVTGLPTGQTNRSAVAGVIATGERLGVPVIAEGVETPDQRDLLRTMGASHAQGHLFSDARPLEHFVAPPRQPGLSGRARRRAGVGSSACDGGID